MPVLAQPTTTAQKRAPRSPSHGGVPPQQGVTVRPARLQPRRQHTAMAILTIVLVATGLTQAQVPPVQRTFALSDGSELEAYVIAPASGGPSAHLLLAFPPGVQTRQDAGGWARKFWARSSRIGTWTIVVPVAPGPPDAPILFHLGAEDAAVALLNTLVTSGLGADQEVFLAGASSGGAGALRVALLAPDDIAGIALIPGYLPDGASGADLSVLAGIPVVSYLGANESVADADRSRSTVEALQRAGADASLVIVEGAAHKVNQIGADTVLEALEKGVR